MGAFNGSGVFVRSYSWTSDAANNIDITASRMDTEDTGFASGLTLCVTRDGQGQMAADFLPSVASTYNLGNGSFPWNNLTLGGGVTAGAASQFTTMTVTTGITYQLLNQRASTTVYKAANTSRANTTTASADPDLQIGLPSTGTYAIELWLNDGLTANSTGGLKGTIAYSGTSTAGEWGLTGSGTGTTPVPLVVIGVTAQQFQTSQNAQGNLQILGYIVATSTGTLSLNWAQQSSNATASIVAIGSWMRVTKLA